jgi:hypothetical protein
MKATVQVEPGKYVVGVNSHGADALYHVAEALHRIADELATMNSAAARPALDDASQSSRRDVSSAFAMIEDAAQEWRRRRGVNATTEERQQTCPACGAPQTGS